MYIHVFKSHLRPEWRNSCRGKHSPVHSNGSEREDRNVDCDWLDEEHQVAHGAAKHPTTRVEGVGQSERHAGHTHEHVGEGQVSDEEVGDVVHLASSADDVEEQVVPEDAHGHDQRVAGDDERLEGLQQGHVRKLGAVVGGVAPHRNLVNMFTCLSAATAITLHGSNLGAQ